MGLKQDLVFRVAKRWIAGKDMASGLEAAREANAEGFSALINFLGEDVTDLRVAGKEADEYFGLQKALSQSKLDGSVSVKPTQLGLLFDENLVSERLEQLATAADSMGQELWLDMESSKFTGKTIELCIELLGRHRKVGLALQAYLKRSEGDLGRLLDAGARVRLVKGAYREEPSLVYGSRRDVNESYSRLMHALFEKGRDFTIATHDSALVEEAKSLAAGKKSGFSFAMLRGIRDDLKAELVREGFRVVEYIPYGDDWYAYSIRRMREHPSNVWLLLRSLF